MIEIIEIISYFLTIILVGLAALNCVRHTIMFWSLKKTSVTIAGNIAFGIFSSLAAIFLTWFIFSILATGGIDIDYILYPLQCLALCSFIYFCDVLFNKITEKNDDK